MLPPFTLVRPDSLDAAVRAVADGGVPYCGGTELLPVMQMGLLAPEGLVDLKRVPGLGRIDLTAGGQLDIGAAVTHHTLARSATVATHLPTLGRVAGLVGNIRVRTTGTLGGNLCFAEPKSDLTTMLIALDAAVVLRSADGERQLPLDDFLLGGFETALEPGEILTAIRVPVPPAPAVSVYRKYQTAERPTAGVALVGGGHAWTLVVGAVAERPARFTLDRLAAADPDGIAAHIDVTPDLAGAEDYKRHVTAVFIRRAIAQAQQEAAA